MPPQDNNAFAQDFAFTTVDGTNLIGIDSTNAGTVAGISTGNNLTFEQIMEMQGRNRQNRPRRMGWEIRPTEVTPKKELDESRAEATLKLEL